MLDVRNDQRAERERGRSVNNSRCCCAHTASSSGPRCSRNAPSTLLIASAEPDPEGLPGACQLQLGSETAARTCQRAACGLPATTALPATTSLSRCPLLALSARALLQRPHPCSGLIQSGSSRGCSGVFGAAGAAVRGVGRAQKRGWRFLNGRRVLSFWPFLHYHPLRFAAS